MSNKALATGTYYHRYGTVPYLKVTKRREVGLILRPFYCYGPPLYRTSRYSVVPEHMSVAIAWLPRLCKRLRPSVAFLTASSFECSGCQGTSVYPSKSKWAGTRSRWAGWLAMSGQVPPRKPENSVPDLPSRYLGCLARAQLKGTHNTQRSL